jgi:hypothetical protein
MDFSPSPRLVCHDSAKQDITEDAMTAGGENNETGAVQLPCSTGLFLMLRMTDQMDVSLENNGEKSGSALCAVRTMTETC